MATDQDLRPRYYEDQYLGADDLDQAVSYGHVQLARHELGAHTWGISTGLDLIEKPRPGGNRVDIFITPGYAWDGFGRALLVLAPAAIPESLFAGIQFDPQNSDDTSGKGRLVPVWLQYDEERLRFPPRGFESCVEGGRASRVQETFRIVAGQFGRLDQHGSVFIDGVATDPREALRRFNPAAPKLWDESVSHQEYPSDDTTSRWLVPIGAVRWLPGQNGPGQFVKRDDSQAKPDSDAIRELRHYAGVIAESIEGAGGVIRLRNRFKDPSAVFFRPPIITTDPAKPPENELVWVEGDLRVIGDARIAGGKLAFRAADGKDEDTPLEIRRSGAAQGGAGNRTLQIIIGPETQDTNRFAIGRLKADQSMDQKFVVTSDGKVGIATATPSARLSIEGSVPQHGALNVFSSSSDFEYDGGNDKLFVFQNTNADGKTAFMGGNVGIGTANPRERLEVNGNLLVTGLINGHDLDAELQAQAGVKGITVIQGTVSHNGNIWFGVGTGRAFDERILTLKSITLPAAIPGAWYEIECSYVPIQGVIPAGAVRGRVTARCRQKMQMPFGGVAVINQTVGVASYTVIGWDE
jgi:hypothetical protein